MNRNLSFDTMRGMAILFVLAAHFLTNSVVFDDYSTTMLGNTSLNFSFFGNTGVILFFYLSGYLIYASIDRGKNIAFFFNFYPVYGMRDIFANIFFIKDFLNAPYMNNVYWSLLVEVRFYFIIFVFFLLSRYFKFLKIEYLLLLLLLVNYTKLFFTGSGSWFLTWLLLFFIGILFYKYVTNKIKIGILLVCYFAILVSVYIFRDLSSFLSAVMCTLIFAFCFYFNCTNRILIFFGNISYSLYLAHAPIGYSLFYFITKNFTEDFVALKIIFVTLISILIAMFSYKFIESIYFKGVK
ncbi:acyltransferase family protein [Campylobacter concisus]|uniref:acyltransferase family protein n=1 Tax=Campylobacter concisus TaxID=199 RepID=UPI00131E2059|nr:acyltransferase [Campylobacter concisus]